MDLLRAPLHQRGVYKHRSVVLAVITLASLHIPHAACDSIKGNRIRMFSCLGDLLGSTILGGSTNLVRYQQ